MVNTQVWSGAHLDKLDSPDCDSASRWLLFREQHLQTLSHSARHLRSLVDGSHVPDSSHSDVRSSHSHSQI